MTVLYDHSGGPPYALWSPPHILAADGDRVRCVECLHAFVPVHPRQLFCTTSHKTVWHNRQTVRGRTLLPLVIAARLTRGGHRGDIPLGRKARQDAEQLIGRMIDDDRAITDERPHGRMSMVDYVRLRLHHGFEIA